MGAAKNSRKMIGRPSPGRRSSGRGTNRLGNARRRKPWFGDGRRREPVKANFIYNNRLYVLYLLFILYVLYILLTVIFLTSPLHLFDLD